jgi:hypothetical protein
VAIYLASPIVLWFLLGIALAIIWKYWELSEPTWIGKSAERLEPVGDCLIDYTWFMVLF